jgi:hypothetical protein
MSLDGQFRGHTSVDTEHPLGPHVKMPGRYRKLDSATKEIRLLLLKAGQAEHPIHCEVRYTAFLGLHTLPYETISYV